MTFEEFAHARLDSLLRFAKVLCVDRGLAEDVVQEVLLRVYARWETISILDQPEVYIRRMIVNEFLSWRRKWARVVPTEALPELAVGDHADLHADRSLLGSRIVGLPRRQRAVIVLRYWGGLSDTEIAEELGCSVNTVRAHISRALATLRIDPAPSVPSVVGKGDRRAE